MAVDKLIDSTIENACRTAEANAIRAKTGSAAKITYDWANSKGFADAINTIPIGLPIEISTAAAMDAVLIAANVGKVYMFVGTTDATYTNGDLYVVEEV